MKLWGNFYLQRNFTPLRFLKNKSNVITKNALWLLKNKEKISCAYFLFENDLDLDNKKAILVSMDKILYASILK